MAGMIRVAEGGNLKAAYTMYQYYAKKQNQVKSDEWLAKTRQMVESAPTDDRMAQQILKRLNRAEKITITKKEVSTVSESHTLPAEKVAPQKRAAPRI